MGDIEKLDSLRKMIGEDVDDSTLTIYLDFAKQVILNRLYPFGTPIEICDVPEKYNYDQLQIATYLYVKRGAEGEIVHNENGISRTYESSDIPESLLARIVPYVGVF